MVNAKYFAIDPNGRKFNLIIEIDEPKLISENRYCCPMFMSYFIPEKRETGRGLNSLGAICSCITLAIDLLQLFQDKGGRIFFADNEEHECLHIEELFSGLYVKK